MIRLNKDDLLYVYSSEYVQCNITGKIYYNATPPTVEIYDYIVRAGTTRLVYRAFEKTDVTGMFITEAPASTVIKIFVNGTGIANQVYAGTIPAGFSTVMVAGQLVNHGVVAVAAPTNDVGDTKSISITAPTASENITMFFTDDEVTVAQIYDVIRGTGASLTWNLAYGANRGIADATLFGVDRTTVSTTGADTSIFANAVIPANTWIWLTTSAASGTIEDINITIRFI